MGIASYLPLELPLTFDVGSCLSLFHFQRERERGERREEEGELRRNTMLDSLTNNNSIETAFNELNEVAARKKEKEKNSP